MIRRGLLVAGTLALLVVLTGAGCGSNNALVGGSCAQGYTQCGAACVDLTSDPEHCGACGSACAGGVVCVASACGGSTDARATDQDADANGPDGTLPSPDGSDAGGEATDASDATTVTSDADASDALSSSADASDADATEAIDGGVSADAATDAASSSANDGSMTDSPAEGATPTEAGQTDAASSDAETSESGEGDGETGDSATDDGPNCAPLTYCNGVCVDTTQNVSNCGSCGNSCYSGICQNSACVGAAAGSVVLVGHDFESYSPAQATLLLNALLLARGISVPVLAYERYASAGALASIRAIAGSSAAQIGRSIALTETVTDTDVANVTVGKYGVVLVADEPSAPSGALATLGATWATTLASYTQAGGVVVLLDGDTGVGEMPALATATGLLSVTAHQPVVTSTALDVTAKADALAVDVGNTYAAGLSSASFATEASGGNVVYVVMTPGDVSPVVVHKVF